MMKTEHQSDVHPTWFPLVELLRKHNLVTAATLVLDALGPLTIAGAQLVHAGSPLFRPALSSSQVDMITSLLEDPNEMRLFTAYLREDVNSGK